ncbi:hypothetical protein CEXT_481011 [Caerostris extrusa]|uniref:Uncharacterized protein n=1 Tax=Caerostris extrusa TaxID=172846 RepID=A0AAV4SRC1_CAEEX|nr:hypothetical protein CEXT_481011 [Caerostris extrusa]
MLVEMVKSTAYLHGALRDSRNLKRTVWRSLSEQIILLEWGGSSREVAAREGEVATYLHGALRDSTNLKENCLGNRGIKTDKTLGSGAGSSREVVVKVAAYLHGALRGIHQLKRELSGE